MIGDDSVTDVVLVTSEISELQRGIVFESVADNRHGIRVLFGDSHVCAAEGVRADFAIVDD